MQQNLSRSEAILHAAKQAFLRHGYDTASMDLIAEAAGTTKRTLYNHFTSKEQLFEAVVAFTARMASANLQTPATYDADPTEAVTQFCLRHAYWSSWTDAIAMQRIVIALVPRFPRYAHLLYSQAIRHAEEVLASYLEAHFPAHPFPPFGTAPALARFLLYGLSGERRFLALLGAEPAYPPPDGPAPFADLPEEATIRALVSLLLGKRP